MECIIQNIRSVRALSYPKNGEDTQIIEPQRCFMFPIVVRQRTPESFAFSVQ
jgi:hypothetical protein